MKKLVKKSTLRKSIPVSTVSKHSLKNTLPISSRSKAESLTAKTPLTPSPSESWATSNAIPVPSFDEALKNANGAEGKPAPKKRGRPPKSASDAGAGSTGTQTPSPGNSALGATSAPSPGFDIPKEALAPLLQFPYTIAAKRTGYAGFELSKEETDALVPMLDAVLKQYMPKVSGPHATLMMFLGSLTVITGIRYSMYLDFIREKQVLQNAKTDAGINKPYKAEAHIASGVGEIMPGVFS